MGLDAGTGDETPSGLAYGSSFYILLGRILLEWNDLEGAERYLSKGLDGSELGLNEIVVKGQFARTRLQIALGELDEVPDLRRLVMPSNGGLVSLAGALEAWACLMAAARTPDDPQAAHWWRRAAGWAAPGPLVPDDEDWRIIERLVCARVRVVQSLRRDVTRYLARETVPNDLRSTLKYLDAQAALLQARDWNELLVQTWIVKAMALLALGREADALAALAGALERAAPGGYRRVFLDEGEPMAQLLGLAAQRGVAAARPFLAHLQPVAPEQPLEEPLTERELGVLRLLVTDLTSTEIAEELVVSVNTVRSHIQHIYQKLAVHSRYEAVARAQELGLL